MVNSFAWHMLPEKVEPVISDVNSTKELGYIETTLTRTYNITAEIEYIEYLESHNDRNFYIFNTEIKTHFCLDSHLITDVADVRPYYPKMYGFNGVGKCIKVNNLHDPLLRCDLVDNKELKSDIIEETSDGREIKINYNYLLRLIKSLQEDVMELKKKNHILEKRIEDLTNGLVPEDMKYDILKDMFEGIQK